MNTAVIDLVGAVCLLLWGLRTVSSGVKEAFGPRLKRAIGAGTRNRFTSFGVGLVATLALQSSTSTALMTANFAGRALIATSMAQAVMLGANLGTSLAARLFVIGSGWLVPAAITLGFVLFALGRGSAVKATGRAIIGLGLILLSLHMLGQATAPLPDSSALQALLRLLADAPLVMLIIGAVLAMLASSSLAVVLLVVSLDLSRVLEPSASIALVLGANLGGAVLPVIATLGEGALARRVPVGNLIVRAIGCFTLLPFADQYARLFIESGVQPRDFAVDAHLVFNLGLAVIFLPLVDLLAAAMNRAFPQPAPGSDGPRYLDASTLAMPSVALACAARETLRIGDRVISMLDCSLTALRTNDVGCCARLSGFDDEVDRLQSAVKLFLAELGRGTLSDEEMRRSSQIMSYALNLEHVGDILDKSVRELAEKKIKHQLSFSRDGLDEISTFYESTIENLRLAQSLFLSQDTALARRLFEAKVDVRRMEETSAERHLTRLREGRPESVQTSALHLDLLRDLKRINAHILSVANPILQHVGGLRDSRLTS